MINACLSWTIIIFSLPISVADHQYHDQALLRVNLWTKSDQKLVRELTKAFRVQLWGRIFKEPRPLLVSVPPDELQLVFNRLHQNKLKYEMVSRNVTHFIEEQKLEPKSTRRRFTRKAKFKTEKYHRFNDIEMVLKGWNDSGKSLVSLNVLGRSHEGRKIYSLTISTDSADQLAGGVDKKGVLIDCGFHPREWISTATCLYIIQKLITHSESNYKLLLSRVNFYFMPVVNPDGYVYTWTHDRLWRKNRAPNRGQVCRGVDLNRNFAANFAGVGSEKNPCSEVYHGNSAFSEPESKALKEFSISLKSKKNLDAYFSIHSYGQYFIYPLGYSKRKASNWKKLNSLGKTALRAIKKVTGVDYKTGQTSKLLYLSSGGSDDWMHDANKVKIVYTVEVRDTGHYGFLLPSSLIKPTAEEVWAGIRAVLKKANVESLGNLRRIGEH